MLLQQTIYFKIINTKLKYLVRYNIFTYAQKHCYVFIYNITVILLFNGCCFLIFVYYYFQFYCYSVICCFNCFVYGIAVMYLLC